MKRKEVFVPDPPFFRFFSNWWVRQTTHYTQRDTRKGFQKMVLSAEKSDCLDVFDGFFANIFYSRRQAPQNRKNTHKHTPYPIRLGGHTHTPCGASIPFLLCGWGKQTEDPS
jgi:hypothetical protein